MGGIVKDSPAVATVTDTAKNTGAQLLVLTKKITGGAFQLPGAENFFVNTFALLRKLEILTSYASYTLALMTGQNPDVRFTPPVT